MNHEQIQEMVETFSKAATLISSATSQEDMFVVGMMSIPLMESHRQMVERMKTVIDEKPVKIPTPVSSTMS